MTRRFLRLIGSLVVIGCRGSDAGTDVPIEPEVPLVVGSYCASTTPKVERSGTKADVTIYQNTITKRIVTRPSDGAQIEQSVRGCLTIICADMDATGKTDAQLIGQCQNLIG